MNLFRTKTVEQSMADADEPGRKLKRSLSTWDLMIMGVAVAVGAGIFSVGAKAAANFAGPAVTISFGIAAVTCALAIMCYAEFATAIPVAGSAYVFTYATMGEVLAWIKERQDARPVPSGLGAGPRRSSQKAGLMKDRADHLAQVAQSQPKPKRPGRRRSDRTVCAPPPQAPSHPA